MSNGEVINEFDDDTPSLEELEAQAQAAAATVATGGEIEKLKLALEQKTKEAEEAQNSYLRSHADFENYRKRMQRELADFRKYANEQMAAEILTVVDHLGLAIKHAAETGETNDGLRQGVELVYKQLRDALDKFGVKPFPAEGEPFDPAKHDAMMQVVTDEAPENIVVQVFQDGYLYHDKVLRHAKVGVAKKPATKESETTE